jgi:hypothetical protein
MKGRRLIGFISKHRKALKILMVVTTIMLSAASDLGWGGFEFAMIDIW